MLYSRLALTVCGLSLVFGSNAEVMAQSRIVNRSYNTPYSQSHALQSTSNQARLVYSARLHPETEVTRQLHAQPVWPWMAKVVLGGPRVQTENDLSSGDQRQFSDGGTILHTWIDPLQKIDGSNGLDEDHSLVRAQRLHLQMSGTTTSELAAIKNASQAARPRGAIANHALIIIPPQHYSNRGGQAQTHRINFNNPMRKTSGPSRLIMPEQHKDQPKAEPHSQPKSQPDIPSVPRQTPDPDKTVAHAG